MIYNIMIFANNRVLFNIGLEGIINCFTPVCVICNKDIGNGQHVSFIRDKGCEIINVTSTNRGDCIKAEPGQPVHKDCRRDYIHQRYVPKPELSNQTKQLRSLQSFDFKTKCLFCATGAKVMQRKRGYDVYPVRTLDFQKTIITKCQERDDDWAICVRSRLEHIIDLPPADAIYHQQCNVNFRTGKNIPKSYRSTELKDSENATKSPGRPVASDQIEAFKNVVSFVENACGQIVSVSDLVKKMKEHCGDRAYTCKHMKNKLLDHFGSNIVISELDGKSDIVSLKVTASSIIHSFHKSMNAKSPEEEKKEIISTAAKLIYNDIQSMDTSRMFYPSPQEVGCVDKNISYLPESLHLFLQTIIKHKDVNVKIASIGQSVIQACRPKGVIAPMQLGLGVQMHHHFGSRFLVDTLNTLGFSVSYKEVQKFEMNAAAASKAGIPDYFPGRFVQFVADNVDHNSRTLDGYNTFHGMGIIACTTPGSKVNLVTTRSDIKASDIAELGKIDIRYFRLSDEEISNNSFVELDTTTSKDPYYRIDLLSKVVWTVRPSKPAWSGLMQLYRNGVYPGQSSVTFMPMIDLNPSDLTCINSTLWFVCKQAERYGFTPVITFDQPLFLKSTTVINNQTENSPLRNIVLRLGGFHTQMSFLGSMGHLMMGTGLQELLEVVYAPNAVLHMMSGKAVARAVRGHFLIDTALHTLLVASAFDIKLPVESMSDENDANGEHLDSEDQTLDTIDVGSGRIETNINVSSLTPRGKNVIDAVGDLFDTLESHDVSLEEMSNDTILTEVEHGISNAKLQLKNNRTASLWLQYMDMISILQQFLRAERSGDWEQHLSAVKSMLPYFAASGHNLYLKSAYIYLQSMLDLEKNHPDVYNAFQTGNHVVRRTDRFWAGLSTDLVIEQVLMRSVKTTGGLTRGRGMSDIQRAQWLLSMPACAEMNSSMQAVTKTEFNSSEQHKEIGKARQCRDTKDTHSFLSFLKERNPFDVDDNCLRNIDTGVTAESCVNVDKASEIGTNILKDMVGKSVTAYSFKRSKQVVTLNTKSTIKINDEVIQVDPQLLFQRLTTAANRNVPEISEIFQYELCSIPSALFDKSGLPRPAQKAGLADAIWGLGECSTQEVPSDVKYVLDGGSLLQRIPWQKNFTFLQICNQYYECIQKRYTGATVVFDGYLSGPSIKDITHIRRGNGVVGTVVKFTPDTPFRSKKDVFLNNEENKKKFIDMLGQHLIERGVVVIHARDDADMMIVETAVSESSNQETIVIGEDTDLLVLLCHHANMQSHDLFFKSDIKRSAHYGCCHKCLLHATFKCQFI